MDIEQMIDKIEAMADGIDDAVMGVVEDRGVEAVLQTKSQLMRGEDRNGEPTSPGYANDPWFKNAGAWQRYVERKRSRYGVAAPSNGGVNFYMNGSMLHDYLTWYREGDAVVIEAVGSPIWDSVTEKWGLKCFAPNYDWLSSEIGREARQAIVGLF